MISSRRRFAWTGLLATVAASLSTRLGFARTTEPTASDGPDLTLAELSARLIDLRAKYDALTQDLARHAEFDPPVGTIMAFAGPWPPIDPATGQPRSELDLGWALCDGRSFADLSLRPIHESLVQGLGRTMGTFQNALTSLPDLRGCFLRGIETNSRPAAEQIDKDGIRAPLDRQAAATAMPTKAFTNSIQPAFDPAEGGYAFLLHEEPGGGWSAHEFDLTPGEPCQIHKARVRVVPEHTHAISGGDAETRPVNVAVHYIVKFRGR